MSSAISVDLRRSFEMSGLRFVKFGALAGVAAICFIAVGQEPNPSPVRRYGMVLGVREDKIEEYKKLHAAVWPGVATCAP